MLQELEMVALMNALRTYLDTTLGLSLVLRPWVVSARLPPYLRERYDFRVAAVLDTPCIFMFDRDPGTISPMIIAKHRETIEARNEVKAVYVASVLSSVSRSRLVGAKVSFVVPGRQLYLPPLGIDFRERFPASRAERTLVSPAAQLVALRALRMGLMELPRPSELAAELGYSRMTISRVYNELAAGGVVQVQTNGRVRKAQFMKSGRDLWEALLPLLSNPVGARFTADAAQVDLRDFLLAGLSALSARSDLAPPTIPVYAVLANSEGYRRLVAKRLPFPEGGARIVDIEVWKYAPQLVATGTTVDELSLYLSLQDEEDERIRAAAQEMLEVLPW
jgi:DNA-binding MarR family transcriptional regulator